MVEPTMTTDTTESGRRHGHERIIRRTLSSSTSLSSFSNNRTKPALSAWFMVACLSRRRRILMLLLLTAAASGGGGVSTSAIGSMRRATARISAATALGRQQRHAVAFVGGSLRWRTTTTNARASTTFSTKEEYKNQHQQQQRRLGIISTQQQGHHLMAATKGENNNGEKNQNLSERRRNFSANINVVRPQKRASSIPPSYDAFLEEEGFGGYDYVPDIYDMQDNYTSSWQKIIDNGIINNDDDYADATLLQEQLPISPDEEFFVAAHPPKTRPITTAKTVAKSELPNKKKKQSHQSSSSSSSSSAEPNPTTIVSTVDHPLPSIFDMMSSPVSAGNEDSSDSDLEYGMSSSAWEEETSEIEDEELDDADGDVPEKEPSPLTTGRKTTTTRRSAPSPPTPTSPNWNDNDVERSNFLRKASTGLGVSTDLEVAQERLKSITGQIYQQNNGKEFNIQSPRQVAKVLFGSACGSTNKEVLEGMAAGGGNRMADLILQHRAAMAEVKRQQRRIDTQDKRVRSASAVIRPAATTKTNTARTNSTIANSTSTSNNNSTAAAAAAAVIMEELDTDPLILVDASAYIFRAYYSMPPIHRSDGMPTGAVLGFCNMLNRLVVNRALRGEQARLVLVFDPSKGTTFRHELYSEYKGHRPSVPVDLIPQFPLIRHAAVAYGICQLEAPSFEADDVIATLATMALKEGIDANILSSDKDLMQLVTDKDVVPSINMIEPMTMARVTYDDVVDKWGVPPKRLGDLLALAGDASDNVPGVPGIGPKIAAMLLDEFSTLDNLLDNVENVKQKTRREKLQQHADMARLSRKLVDLKRNVPLDAMTFPDGVATVGDLRMDEFNPDRILAFYDQMGFRDLKRRFQNQLQRGQRPLSSSSFSAPSSSKSPSSSASFIPRSKSSYGKKEKTEIPKPEDYADVPF